MRSLRFALALLVCLFVGVSAAQNPPEWEVKSDGTKVTVLPKLSTPYYIVRQAWTTKGEYRLIIAANQKDKAPLVWVVPLKIGEIQPGPEPEPNPNPNPNPDPKPNPTPTPGPLHVLVVYQDANFPDMKLEEIDFLTSKPLRDYLMAKCDKDKDGPTFRFWDKEVDLTNVAEDWKAIYKEATVDEKGNPRPLPWLIITNGKDWYRGEKPKTTAAFLELLQKYGGK